MTRAKHTYAVRLAVEDGEVTVQVIDQRRGGAEPEVSRERGPNGREIVRVLIRDEVRPRHRARLVRSANGRQLRPWPGYLTAGGASAPGL